MKYRVYARRSTTYEIEEATTREQAIDLMIQGDGEEIDGSTERIIAIPICPDCDSELTNRTTRDTGSKAGEEPTYCDQCDREIYTEEEEQAAANQDDRPF